MKKEKLNNYKLTGSIHTLSIKTPGEVNEIDESVADCIKANMSNSSAGQVTTAIINPNKMVGDLYSYDEFQIAMDTILGGMGINEYKLIRVDMRFDNYDPKHYQDYAKLNRYLLSMLAAKYKVRNTYRSVNLFSEKQLSVAIKSRYMEVENYDKLAESGGTDAATSRLETRSKEWRGQSIPEEFMENWFTRWDKATEKSNIEKVHQKYNDELEKIYKAGKNAKPVQFRSLTDFLIQYQNCIFCRAQMIDLLSRFDEVKNPARRADNHKNKYGIEYFSYSDVQAAVEEIKRATLNYYLKEQDHSETE